MEAATSTFQHSFGLGPRGPNPPFGAQQAQGPHQPGPGPSGASHPEEHHHQQQQQQQQQPKPFFYIQPSQPYMPMQSMQWPVPVPMPVSYNPYYGFPGLGYGMPMMPHCQPAPYMEPPSFVLPHTHLHLMDYRRLLNPQYYQTMAYQSRRFRYQHNSQTREMTSSEVQTEPLPATQRTSTPGSSDAEASSGLQLRNSSPRVPTSQPLPPALAVQKRDHSLDLKDMAPSSTTRTPPNGSFVIQTEEVRIECCTTPAGLQVLHSHETAEVSHRYSQDVVQRRSIVQGCMLQDEGPRLPAERSEQALQACPDILLVGKLRSSEKIPEIPAPEESRNQRDLATTAKDVGSQAVAHGDVQEMSSEKDPSTTSKNFHFKVVHLPFHPKNLDELWSLEETVIPSPHDETLAGVAEVPSEREEAPTKDVTPVIELPPLAEDELEDMDKAPEDEMVPEADMYPTIDGPVAEEAPTTELTHPEEFVLAPNLPLLDNSPNQHRRETNVQDHQDTSFESLPAYLPSTSWLDFDGDYYCSKMPPTPKKQRRPLSNHGLEVPTRRRKLDLDYKEQPTVRKLKERYKPTGKVDRRSLSDHECCLNRNFNENAFNPYASKRERLCSRCLAKSSICTSANPGLDSRSLKRKAVPFQQCNNAFLPTCEACKSHSKKGLITKGSDPDVRGSHHGQDTEGESSENSLCRLGSKWTPTDHPRKPNDLKKPLASKQNVNKCPVAIYPKQRGKNCACNEPQHQSIAWERLRHCPHGNAIREMDENCAVPFSLQDKWRIMDQIYLRHRWQTEKSCKAVMPNPDCDGSKSEARSSYFNKHKISQAQSQGTRRKDTRC